MPIKILFPVEPTEINDEIDLQGSILQRAYELIDKLPTYQNQARQNTKQSQWRQKVCFDANIRPETFEIGNKVWIQRKELEASRLAKFEDKRFGPFLIHEKLDNGAYKLRTIEGKILQKYYNSDRLAKYYEPQAWEPVVVIDSPGNF